MTRWIILISLLCVFALALMLAYANGAIVRLDYLVGSEQVHLSSALLGAAVVGWLLGLVSSFSVVFRLRRESRRLQRSIREAEAEIRNLRSLPFKNER
ncbi:MAG TPA: LapA family protein [Gammaproteobacteria bacterium]|nr:LapA family protein [Gammaproteobacteria bacterium]